ncbi:MAG: hypothetical protein J5707_04825 [Candidatus Methanomethylophilus sp.]|nr:hypothetical protein [Methanomethylophilus sp.]
MAVLDAKVLIAVTASLAVAVAGCGLVLLMDGEDISGASLFIDSAGTFENGVYERVIVSASVGDGHVVLRNITILESLIIRGGGSDSVVIEECTVEGTTVVDKTGGQDVRICLVDTVLPDLEANSGIIIEGDSDSEFASVTLKCASTAVRGSGTLIRTLTLLDKVSLDLQDGTVNDLKVPENAAVIFRSGPDAKVKDITLSGTMTVNGTDTRIDRVSLKDGSSLNVSEGTVDSVEVPENASAALSTGTDGVIVSADIGGTVTVNGPATNVGKVDMRDGSSLKVDGGSVGYVEIPKDSAVRIDRKGEGRIGSAIVGDNVSIDVPEGSDIGSVNFSMAEGSSGDSVKIRGETRKVDDRWDREHPRYPWLWWLDQSLWDRLFSRWNVSP